MYSRFKEKRCVYGMFTRYYKTTLYKTPTTMTAPSTRLVKGKRSIQLVSDADRNTTGFATARFATGEVYTDSRARYYYILLVREGMINLSCKLYSNKSIAAGTMTFIPKGNSYCFTATDHAEVLFFAFTTTIIRTDDDMLRYFCSHAAKRSYTFTTLPLCSAMTSLTDMIVCQLHERKMKNCGIAKVWNTYFFHIMQSYYRRDEVTAFMRPIISGAVDFEAFVENNYLEADGNVAKLAALSGMSYDAFQDKFVRHYGTTAKQWLDERMREQLLALAAIPNLTPQQMAAAIHYTPQKLNKLCQRYWGMAPGALIREKGRLTRAAYAATRNVER